MSPVDVLALSMWPLAAAGLWLGNKARAFPIKSRNGTLLTGAAAFLIIGPFLTLTVFYPHHSAAVLALEYSTVAVFGALILMAVWRVSMERWRAMAGAVIGFLMLGWGLWHLAGDFLIRRVQIEGYVSDKRLEPRSTPCSTRCTPDHYIYVAGRRYASTAVVFAQLQAGDRIRAKIGRASRRILWFESRPR